MKIPIYQVDAFTNKFFGGNPAAVCLLESWPEDELLQNIGAENNLAETAFLVRVDDYYEIRWFTPTIEVDLCGHATLASAHVLFNHMGLKTDNVQFKTVQHGMLSVNMTDDLLTLNFPSSKLLEYETSRTLIDGLGKSPVEVYASRDILAIYETEDDIRSLKPNFETIKKLDQLGVIVSAPGENSDFVSRFFAPNAGINEDPVTGSAHTTLIPYWSKKLKKDRLHAYQLSKRKGELFCENKGNRVLISGNAKTFLVGEIFI